VAGRGAILSVRILEKLTEQGFEGKYSIDKRQIEELATMRFLENGENVVFLGPPGVGKAHLATALGLTAAGHRRSTYYINSLSNSKRPILRTGFPIS